MPIDTRPKDAKITLFWYLLGEQRFMDTFASSIVQNEM